MADTLTAHLSMVYRASNTVPPDWTTESWPTYTASVNSGEVNKLSVSIGSPVTHPLNHYMSIAAIFVHNIGGTDLEVSYNDGTHAIQQKVAAGRPFLVTSVSTGTNFVVTSLGATTEFLMAVAGT